MKGTNIIDIKEDSIEQLDYELLTILLQDKSSGKNIIWATDDYSQMDTDSVEMMRYKSMLLSETMAIL